MKSIQLTTFLVTTLVVSTQASWFWESKSISSATFDVFNYFRTVEHVDCFPTKMPPWVTNPKFEKERNTFLFYEKQFESKCSGTDFFHLKGNYNPLKDCESLIICNITNCSFYPRNTLLLAYELKEKCVKNVKENLESDFVVLDADDILLPSFLNLSMTEKNNLIETSGIPDIEYYFQDSKINFEKTFVSPMHELYSNACTANNSRFLLLEGLGNLPTQCSEVAICNPETCFMISKTGMALSFTSRRSQFLRSWGLDAPTPCKVSFYHRVTRRAAVNIYEDIMVNKHEAKMDLAKEMTNQTHGLLKFNLPGYRYCGPGTDIEQMDDEGGPVNKLDELCRGHDIDYLIGENPDVADADLLTEIWKIGHPMLPLFVSVFEAKRYFEKLTGDTYTSSLYYIPIQHRQSLTYYLADKSSFDNLQRPSNKINEGRKLEKKWKDMLHEIWRGYCLSTTSESKILTAANPNMPESSGSQAGSSENTNTEQQQSSQQTGNRLSIERPTQSSVLLNQITNPDYPDPPLDFSPCRMIIGEVLPKDGDAYIELQRVCLPTKHRKTMLNGHYIIVIRAGDPARIYMALSLDNKYVGEVEEERIGARGRRKQMNGYFLIGTRELSVNPDLYFDQIEYISTPSDSIKGVPSEAGATFAVVLLYFPVTPEAKLHREILEEGLKTENNNFIESDISEEMWYVLKEYIQDVFVYGDPCPLIFCSEILRLIPHDPLVALRNNLYIPTPYVRERSSDQTNGNEQISNLALSRCSTTNFPMQNDDFRVTTRTPRARNHCPDLNLDASGKELVRFNMQGQPLQSTAQKLVINVETFFKQTKKDPALLQQDERQMTCAALSLSETTVRKVLKNYELDNLITPGKKRKQPFRAQRKIDDFYVDLIKRTIQQFYRDGIAPFVYNIYDTFMDGVTKQEATRRENGEEFEPLTISRPTFRLVLRKLGYRFKKIDLRDAVLMRPDITMLRGKYLAAIRKNDQSENPMPVVFMDETWVDPHARTGKGWVKINCENYRERALYTFAKNKVSRGPRIIVIHAGGSEGLVNGALAIYKVSKRKAAEEYHQNVNAEVFEKWFTNLMDKLDETGKKHIIVMDNAPYHSTTEAVRATDLKHTMYTWLKNNLPADEVKNLKPERDLYKWEIWDMAKKLKKENNYYKIDRMAEARGHRVLRLSPYNCDLNPIEGVWKDIKDAVRKKNFDQNLNTVMATAKEVMEGYTAEQFRKHISHVKRLENEYWRADGFFDGFMENNPRFVICDTNADDCDNDSEDEVDPEVVTSLVHDSELLQVDDEDELLDV